MKTIRLIAPALLLTLSMLTVPAMARKRIVTPQASKTTAQVPTDVHSHVPDATAAPATNDLPADHLPPATLSVDPSAPIPTEPTTLTTATTTRSSHLFGVHAALGLPHPVSAGLTYVHPSKLFSAELNAGAFSVSQSDVDVKMSNQEIGLRYHPFAGSFYAGLLFGNQKISGEKTEDINGIESVTAKVEVKSAYFSPHVGWLWSADDGGFFFSMDVGYQSPSNAEVDFTTNASPLARATDEYQTLDRDVRDAGKALGETGLPLLTLVKVGWLF